MSDDPTLRRAIEAFKASSPEPPEHLEAGILAAIREARLADEADSDATGDNVVAWRRNPKWSPYMWATAGAIAATLVIGSALLLRQANDVIAPDNASRILVADALRQAEAAEREHARAIAQLELVAQPFLARVQDPTLAAPSAAKLVALSNQLQFLDETIAEINGFLEGNRGHPGGRTTLLAAYTKKTDVLRDVLALQEEVTS